MLCMPYSFSRDFERWFEPFQTRLTVPRPLELPWLDGLSWGDRFEERVLASRLNSGRNTGKDTQIRVKASSVDENMTESAVASVQDCQLESRWWEVDNDLHK